ncbi:DDE-type integrase/transposase/recombinase [Deinococcus sp. 14RED07]|uniref:Mu transposase C-terminal domain-containing protein n=1 Tax=Deinococcus sp. 14RED07 TaxID=2745874 RepID=UPI001E3180D9|nr:Mu transposase C-terminal domain-containing protein [Deinococcus sp. 14RED07]MCD0175524.1 DDE-type integrase/transposase/recombinase [Deinococcus sp. 14RED07]
MLDLTKGSLLLYQGREVRAVRPRDLDRLVVEDVLTGRLSDVPIAELQGVTPLSDDAAEPPTGVDAARLEEARHRMELIAPLLPLRPRSRQAVEARARETNSSASTLYRLLAAYEASDHIDALARRPRSDAGRSRQSATVQKVMDAVIEEAYLTRQRTSIKKTHEELCARCQALELTPPSRDTLARRIARLSPLERARRRHGASATKPLKPVRGKFPGAELPLDVVQIDHTELDVFIVDEQDRMEIGRPHITVAIDVMSRVVLGYYVSRDKPSYLSAGSCLTQAILPKDVFLASRHKRLAEILDDAGNDLPILRWPVWGKPTKVHADNAREFWGKMLKRSAAEVGIHVELRPVKRPEYGGHIERLMGTIATELRNLPGATFGSVARRGEYQSQKKAVLTFEELDLWLAIFFAGIYNVRPHSALGGASPLSVYEQALLNGTQDAPPKGLLPRPTPEEATKLRIDFLPSFEVTIQRTGITLDTVTYYHEVLEPYLARRVLGKASDTYVVRRDPRDISQVYFYVAEAGRYFALPFADSLWQRMSIWELRALKADAKKKVSGRVKESDLIREQQAQRRLVAHAQKATRDTRRQDERKRAHDQAQPLILPEPGRARTLDMEDDEPIIPFEVHH